jgi:hypothetical protein
MLVYTGDFVVMLHCKFCQHEWDYKGKIAVTKCPHCMKNVNVKKGMALYEQAHGTGSGETPNPSENFEPQQQQTEQLKKGDLSLHPSIEKIEVVETPVKIPEGLKREQKPKDEKPGAPVKQVTIPIKTVEVICETPFNLLANLTGEEEMKLTVAERDSMTPLVKQLLEQHMGPWMAQYSTEIALAIVVGMIAMRRMSIYSKMKKKEKAKQTPQEQAQGDGVPDWAKGGKKDGGR